MHRRVRRVRGPAGSPDAMREVRAQHAAAAEWCAHDAWLVGSRGVPAQGCGGQEVRLQRGMPGGVQHRMRPGAPCVPLRHMLARSRAHQAFPPTAEGGSQNYQVCLQYLDGSCDDTCAAFK